MSLSFAFGGNTGLSYEELQRRRAFAEAMQQQGAGGAPRTAIEGLNGAAKSILGALLAKKFGAQEDKQKQDYSSTFGNIISGATQPGYGSTGATGYSSEPATNSAFTTPNPGNLPSGTIAAVDRVSPNIPQDFSKIEAAYGLPQGYLAQVAQVESGGNPNAQNPKSSAGGMFQFIDSTAKQYGLKDKFDPYASADAAARLAADNKAILTRALGREPTAGELYLAHQQGGGGAAALLSNPNAPASAIVGDAAVNLNGGAPGMTAGQFADQWTGKIMSAMSDPRATPEQRSALGMLLQQRMQQADPAYQLNLQKSQLELAQMQNPAPSSPEYGLNPVITQDEKGNYHLYQIPKDGSAPKEVQLPYDFTPKQQYLDTGTGYLAAPTVGVSQGDGAIISKDVAGKAAQTAVGEAAGAAQVALPGAADAAKAVADQVESLKNDPYLPNMLGAADSRLPNVSGDAARVQGKMDQLQGGAFLQARQLLKGGGAITDYEGQKAEAAFARMSTAQKPEDYKDALDEFNFYVQQGIKKLEAQAAMTAQPAPSPSPAAPTTGGAAQFKFNPQTGKIEAIQ